MGTRVNSALVRGNNFELGGSVRGYGGPVTARLHGTDAGTYDALLELFGDMLIKGDLTVEGTTNFRQTTIEQSYGAEFLGDTTIGDAGDTGGTPSGDLLTIFSPTHAKGADFTWYSDSGGGTPTLQIVSATGAITAQGLITAAGGLSVPSGQTLSIAGGINVTGSGSQFADASFSGLISANGGITLGAGQDILAADADVEIGSSGTRIKKIWATDMDVTNIVGAVSFDGTSSDTFTINSDQSAGNVTLAFRADGEGTDPALWWDNGAGEKKFKTNVPWSFEAEDVEGTGTFTLGALGVTGTSNLTDLNTSGNTTIGDADTDTVVFNAKLAQDFIPSSTSIDLGSGASRFGTFFGTAVDSGSVTTSGNLDVNGNTVLGSDANDTVTVNGKINQNLLSTANTIHVGNASTRWGTFYGTAVDVTGTVTSGDISTGDISSTGTLTVVDIEYSGTLTGVGGGEATMEYTNDGSIFYDGTGTGIAAAKIDNVHDALDFAEPHKRNWVRMNKDTYGAGGHQVGGATALTQFYIDRDPGAAIGYNVGYDRDSQPMIEVIKDGLTLIEGSDTLEDDFEIIAASEVDTPEVGTKNVIKFHTAISANNKVWYRYHRKSKAVAS